MTTNQTIDGVPGLRSLLERLAKIENISRDEGNGPGRDLCPVCFGDGQWNWVQGSVKSIDPIEHEADCPLAELRALLDAPAADIDPMVEVISLSDCVEHHHPEYGSGWFATDDCRRVEQPAPVPVVLPELKESMINLTDSELDRVLNALAESSYYEPNYDLVNEVRGMLLGKIKDE